MKGIDALNSAKEDSNWWIDVELTNGKHRKWVSRGLAFMSFCLSFPRPGAAVFEAMLRQPISGPENVVKSRFLFLTVLTRIEPFP
jgi:hypothetical protein